MTLVLRPPFGDAPVDGLPVIGALAVTRSINSSLAMEAKVRWPNDVVVGQRKLAGVIAETKFAGNQMQYALLGIGINANFHSKDIKEIGHTLTTLLDQLGSPVDREAIIALLLLEIENVYELASSNLNGAKVLLQELDCSRGRQVKIKVQGEEICGIMDGYESFTRVRIRTLEGSYRQVETSSVIGVEYPDL